MSSSISLIWSQCHVRVGRGSWLRLSGVPIELTAQATARLQAHGATKITVVKPGVIRFLGNEALSAHLVQVFPCCPLAA